MKLFENGVGRPTNEVKKKRRYFVAGISLAVIGLVGLGSLLAVNTINPKNLKGSATLDTKLADLNGDGSVTRDDLVKLKERLKRIYPYDMPGDLNLDGEINFMDNGFELTHSILFPEEYLIPQQIKDVDGNKILNADDGFYLMKVVQGLKYSYGDLNKDGKVNNKDYRALVSYLSSNEKINSKTINSKDLSVSVDGNNEGNYGKSKSNTGNPIIYASRKETEVVAKITNLGDLSKYSKMTIYYRLAGDYKGTMKSSYGFYMNGVRSLITDVELKSNKEGSANWTGEKEWSIPLEREVGSDNVLSVYLNHGTNRKYNTASIKITRIVLR